MVIFEVKSTFLFPLDQAIPRGFLLLLLLLLHLRSSLFSDHSFFALPLWLSISQPFIKDQRNCSECCCALYFYIFVIDIFFLFTSLLYFSLDVFFSFRCCICTNTAFFLLFYLLHFSVARQNSSHHNFFCKLCTIFRSTLFINFLSTHIHCHCTGGTRTHTKSKAHSPLH